MKKLKRWKARENLYIARVHSPYTVEYVVWDVAHSYRLSLARTRPAYIFKVCRLNFRHYSHDYSSVANVLGLSVTQTRDELL